MHENESENHMYQMYLPVALSAAALVSYKPLFHPPQCLQNKFNPLHGEILPAFCVFPCQAPFDQANIIIIRVSCTLNSYFIDDGQAMGAVSGMSKLRMVNRR